MESSADPITGTSPETILMEEFQPTILMEEFQSAQFWAVKRIQVIPNGYLLHCCTSRLTTDTSSTTILSPDHHGARGELGTRLLRISVGSHMPCWLEIRFLLYVDSILTYLITESSLRNYLTLMRTSFYSSWSPVKLPRPCCLTRGWGSRHGESSDATDYHVAINFLVCKDYEWYKHGAISLW